MFGTALDSAIEIGDLVKVNDSKNSIGVIVGLTEDILGYQHVTVHLCDSNERMEVISTKVKVLAGRG